MYLENTFLFYLMKKFTPTSISFHKIWYFYFDCDTWHVPIRYHKIFIKNVKSLFTPSEAHGQRHYQNLAMFNFRCTWAFNLTYALIMLCSITLHIMIWYNTFQNHSKNKPQVHHAMTLPFMGGSKFKQIISLLNLKLLIQDAWIVMEQVHSSYAHITFQMSLAHVVKVWIKIICWNLAPMFNLLLMSRSNKRENFNDIPIYDVKKILIYIL